MGYISDALRGVYQVFKGGTPLPQRGRIVFEGAGFSIVDDPARQATIIKVPAGVNADASGSYQTTGSAGPVLLAAIDLPSGVALRVEVDVHGYDVLDPAASWARTEHYTVRRVGAGTVQVDPPDLVSEDVKAALAAAVVLVQGVGAQLQVMVTGVDGRVVSWDGRIRVLAGNNEAGEPYTPPTGPAGPQGPEGPAAIPATVVFNPPTAQMLADGVDAQIRTTIVVASAPSALVLRLPRAITNDGEELTIFVSPDGSAVTLEAAPGETFYPPTVPGQVTTFRALGPLGVWIPISTTSVA